MNVIDRIATAMASADQAEYLSVANYQAMAKAVYKELNLGHAYHEVLNGLFTDGAHHKQHHLYQVLKAIEPERAPLEAREEQRCWDGDDGEIKFEYVDGEMPELIEDEGIYYVFETGVPG